MVKKTLLSLAVATALASMAGCNVSTTDKYDDSVDTSIIDSANSENAKNYGPVASFSPAMSVVPTSIDILFAAAASTDGTAAVDDTTPPVTTAINDLTGFSTNATIDIPFAGAVDGTTLAGNVHLIKLNNKAYNSAIDALDIASIVIASPITGQKPTGEPIFNPIDASGPQYGTDYVAEVVPMDGGATSMVRLQLLKPLEPKTKYIVAVTDGIKGENGKPVTQSASYKSLLAGNKQFSDALDALVPAVQAWDGIATAFEQTVASGAFAGLGFPARDANKVVLSYGMTTEGTTDVLLAMAAPENYIYGLLDDVATMEELMPAAAIGQIMTGVATALNAGITEEADKINIEKMLLSDDALKNESPLVQLKATLDKRTVRIHPAYKDALSKNLAKAIVDGGAASNAVGMMQGDTADQATITGAISNWNSGNPDKQIPANPAEWTSAHKSYVAQALGQYDDNTTTATLIALAANGAGKLLKDVVHRPAARSVTTIAGSTGVVKIPSGAQGLNLGNDNSLSIQAMIKLPQFMQRKKDNGQSFWRGSASVGAVIDAALGNPTGTTPPKDDDGTLNVSYRFPFAQHVEDVNVPVLVTYPLPDTLGGDCTKPADGWKTIIFQHGITTDRTASLGFANQMAAATAGCYATVAIDMVAHGVDASTTDRNDNPIRYAAFNGFNVAGYVADNPMTTPFAATLAGLAADNVDTFEGLEERHQNLATNEFNEVVPMSFEVDKESGNSGDLFINLTNFQQTRDHMRQTVMDMLNLNASIKNINLTGNPAYNSGTPDLDPKNVYFVGHSLGAIAGMTFVAVNNTIFNNPAIVAKEINPIKAAIFGNPGGQLTKLLENSPTFSAKIIPGLAQAGVIQGSTNMEKFYSVLQATIDTVDPINFTKLLKATNTPMLMVEMVGGGAVAANDRNTDSSLGPVTGLPDALIAAGGYPADTVVPNNASPALNHVPTGLSYLAGTDPLVTQLGLDKVTGTTGGTDPLFLVSKFKEGTHGTISSADAPTVFRELITQSASFFHSEGTDIAVDDETKLDTDN